MDSLLAPQTKLVTNYGQINGNVIGASIEGFVEVNHVPFEGNIPSLPTTLGDEINLMR